MVIENAMYSEDGSAINCFIDGEELGVPVCEGNRHYDELMRQVEEEGLVIQPYVEPV